jgi:sec-independent protein translocase protein TatB
VLNFSPEKLLLVGIIALVVLGPQRLPQAARTLGRLVSELRRMSGSLQSEVRDAMAEPRQVISSVMADTGLNGVTDLRQSVRDTVTGAFTEPAAAEATSRPPTAAPPPPPDDPSLN